MLEIVISCFLLSILDVESSFCGVMGLGCEFPNDSCLSLQTSAKASGARPGPAGPANISRRTTQISHVDFRTVVLDKDLVLAKLGCEEAQAMSIEIRSQLRRAAMVGLTPKLHWPKP